MATPSLDPEELRLRIADTKGAVIRVLRKLEEAASNPEDPEPVRRALNELRELLTVLWLQYDSMLRAADLKRG